MNTAGTIQFAFFGSSRFSVIVLDELEKCGLLPSLVITTPDKKQGRKMILTPTPVKEWAIKRNIEVLDPAKLDATFVETLKKHISTSSNDSSPEIFVVASYGKIIPKHIFDLPKHKTLNIHPSLLPKYRGASPLQSAMLADDKDTGVTIMQIDSEMDHGLIVAQEKVQVGEWPTYEEFEKLMAEKGAQLLAKTLPDWVDGKIKAKNQDHGQATYTKKTKKEEGLIGLQDARADFLKIQAFHEWPQAYFFIKHNGKDLRIKITEAKWQAASQDQSAKLIIEKVIPEGSKEMAYEDFARGYKL
jgi:methionyl-tRNA formyltransferase